MRSFEELKKKKIDLEELKEEIKLEIDYALGLIGSGDYETEGEAEVAMNEAGFLAEHIEPIIYEKLKEARLIGKIYGSKICARAAMKWINKRKINK